MGQMNVLCNKGDKIVEWDENDPESVKRAEKEWKKLKKDGYEFFEAVETKGKRVTRFNKKIGKLIAAPGVKKPADKKRGGRSKAMAGGPNHRLVC
jgi:hypothetical protein